MQAHKRADQELSNFSDCWDMSADDATTNSWDLNAQEVTELLPKAQAEDDEPASHKNKTPSTTVSSVKAKAAPAKFPLAQDIRKLSEAEQIKLAMQLSLQEKTTIAAKQRDLALCRESLLSGHVKYDPVQEIHQLYSQTKRTGFIKTDFCSDKAKEQYEKFMRTLQKDPTHARQIADKLVKEKEKVLTPVDLEYLSDEVSVERLWKQLPTALQAPWLKSYMYYDFKPNSSNSLLSAFLQNAHHFTTPEAALEFLKCLRECYRSHSVNRVSEVDPYIEFLLANKTKITAIKTFLENLFKHENYKALDQKALTSLTYYIQHQKDDAAMGLKQLSGCLDAIAAAKRVTRTKVVDLLGVEHYEITTSIPSLTPALFIAIVKAISDPTINVPHLTILLNWMKRYDYLTNPREYITLCERAAYAKEILQDLVLEAKRQNLETKDTDPLPSAEFNRIVKRAYYQGVLKTEVASKQSRIHQFFGVNEKSQLNHKTGESKLIEHILRFV